MATSVGVRDLKQDAPNLVRRAASGERIVITRYGRPLAVLGPAGSSESASHTRHEESWNAERLAFENIHARLARRHRGKYVAVHGGRVIGSDVDPDRLYERAWKKLRGAVFFMGRVAAEPPIVDMPGMETS